MHVKLTVDPSQAANARERRRMDRMNEAFIRLVPDFAKLNFYQVSASFCKDSLARLWIK